MLHGILFSLISVFESVKTEELPVEFFEKKIRIKELGILVISKTQRDCRFRERTSKE
jgi:hypothetical protein